MAEAKTVARKGERADWLDEDRATPYDVDVMHNTGLERDDLETLLLGTIVADAMTGGYAWEDLMAEASAMVRAEDFRRDRYRHIYAGILALAERGLVPTLELLDAEVAGSYEGYNELHIYELTSNIDVVDASAARFGELCRKVREAADRRRLYGLATKLAEAAGDRAATPSETIERLHAALPHFRVGQRGADTTVAAVATTFREQIATWRADPMALRGMSTGLRSLDEKTLGARRGALWVVGGRSSMGKTAFALTMLRQGAFEVTRGHQVGIVSLEMSADQLMLRLAAMESGQSAIAIEQGLPSVNWEAVDEAINLIEQLPLRIIDASGANNTTNGSRGKMTPDEIRRHVLAWHQVGRMDLLIVDYLELVRPPKGMEKANRDEKLGEIAVQLKALAGELQVPIVVLSQLNREGEKSGSHIPTLANIRGSDEVGNAADVVVFPVRWDYYRKRGQPVPEEVASKPEGYTDIMVAKNRQGPIGMVEGFYLAEQMRFTDYDKVRSCPIDYHGHAITQVIEARR